MLWWPQSLLVFFDQNEHPAGHDKDHLAVIGQVQEKCRCCLPFFTPGLALSCKASSAPEALVRCNRVCLDARTALTGLVLIFEGGRLSPEGVL